MITISANNRRLLFINETVHYRFHQQSANIDKFDQLREAYNAMAVSWQSRYITAAGNCAKCIGCFTNGQTDQINDLRPQIVGYWKKIS
jgi:hypothetical protein